MRCWISNRKLILNGSTSIIFDYNSCRTFVQSIWYARVRIWSWKTNNFIGILTFRYEFRNGVCMLIHACVCLFSLMLIENAVHDRRHLNGLKCWGRSKRTSFRFLFSCILLSRQLSILFYSTIGADVKVQLVLRPYISIIFYQRISIKPQINCRHSSLLFGDCWQKYDFILLRFNLSAHNSEKNPFSTSKHSNGCARSSIPNRKKISINCSTNEMSVRRKREREKKGAANNMNLN